MANDGFVLNAKSPLPPERAVLASIAFFALTLLVFVGFHPFVPPLKGTALAAAADASQGDLTHQLLYIGVFAMVLVATWQKRGIAGYFRAMPLLMVLVQGWVLLSPLWADDPGIAFRRAVLEIILTVSLLLSADTLGPERAFRYLRIVLVGILVVNWVSIPLVDTAVHPAGEIDPALVGNWRGLYGQKNAAGAVCALTALLFLFSRNGKYNWIGWTVSIAALAFLVMTRSKTSLGLFPVCLMAGLAYRFSWRDGLGRAIFTCCAGILIVLGIAAGLFYSEAIARMLQDPTEFTGRAEIWQAYLAFSHDHPWLGAGFGMLANTGGISPMRNYVHSSWVEAIGDSHNGYLQLLVVLGAVGVVLAMAALVIEPLVRFWPLGDRQPDFKALLFALFVFFLLHNFMESDFLESDSGVWFVMLLVLGALRNPDKSLTLAR